MLVGLRGDRPGRAGLVPVAGVHPASVILLLVQAADPAYHAGRHGTVDSLVGQTALDARRHCAGNAIGRAELRGSDVVGPQPSQRRTGARTARRVERVDGLTLFLVPE